MLVVVVIDPSKGNELCNSNLEVVRYKGCNSAGVMQVRLLYAA